MASVNFFSRIYNLWRGFLSLWISDVEKEHPEIAYQNAIDSMIEKYDKLKDATAAIIRRRQDLENRTQKTQTELAQISADLDAAVASGQDDLALLLIPKKDALEAALNEIRAEFAQAEKDANSAKDSLIQVKNEIGKLKAEKDRMLAQMQSAEARVKIQSQLEGLSVDAEVRALDGVREHIKNTVAKANLGEELNNSDLDVRLKKLRETSGDAAARAKLDALKKAKEAQASGNKSM